MIAAKCLTAKQEQGARWRTILYMQTWRMDDLSHSPRAHVKAVFTVF